MSSPSERAGEDESGWEVLHDADLAAATDISKAPNRSDINRTS